VVIELTGDLRVSSIDIKGYTPAPEYPSVSFKDGDLVWNHIDNCSYKVLHDGKEVEMTGKESYALPEECTGEWQIIAVDKNGVEGFASEPLEIYQETVSVPVDVKIDETKGNQVTVSFEVPQDGTYALDWLYSNGNGSVTGYNHCSTRTLYLDSKQVGVSIFPQRGKNDWKAEGWSNPVHVNLSKGVHTAELKFLDTDVNMNIKVDNAHIRSLRLRPLFTMHSL
jgi:hypothetical protein